MEKKSSHITASISDRYYCKNCGWPIVECCCNDIFADYKDAIQWDWWYYCSNKGCKNHGGEGIFQIIPDWCKEIKK